MVTKIEMEYMESVKRIAREMSKPQEIDWEKRRYEIAKDILAAKVGKTYGFGDVGAEQDAKHSVMYADLLIAELKKSAKVKE